jgi:hypothetical protein
MTTVPAGEKPHIQKTNRIILSQRTIYCSSEIMRHVRPHVMMVNMKHFPKKGQQNELIAKLRELVKIYPDHFPSTTQLYLGYVRGL